MRNLKKFLALVLATLMIVGAMVATTVSAAEDDHSDAVEVLNRIDVYRGYVGGKMGADDLVTRWQMALFVSRVTTGFTNDSVWNVETNDTPFTDVTKDHYLGSISSAYKAGIILGVGDNKFAPEANIKYQEALTMVVRALGYKDLDYPLGYIQKAQALGLTDNLNELDNKLETAVTRGQIAEIINNALFVACKDGTTLGTDVLKLKLADVVVVATPKQALANSQLASSGKVVVCDTAKDEYFEVPASDLLEKGEKVEDLIGYSFKIATNNNWQTLVTAYRCNSTTLYNFGDEKTEIAFVQVGYAPNITKRENMIKLAGTNYLWTPGAVSGYPLFEAYQATDIAAGVANAQIHYYDTDKNIVDPLTGIVLLYNLDGKYYINVGTDAFQALRSATAQEIEDAKRDLYITAGNPDQYDTFVCYEQIDNTQASILWNNKFCELKVFDYNGDGKWDHGIFTPYYFGQYTTTDANLKVNGAALQVQKPNANPAAAKIGSNAEVTGKAAKAGDYIIYTYNAFTGVFDIKANLGALKSGKASEINGRGSYVVIDGNKLSYALAPENLLGWQDADIRIPLLQAVITDRTYDVEYLSVAGYLVKTNHTNPYGFTNFVAFSVSDLVGLDANNNLIVNAVIDTTGAKKKITISDIFNYKVGARLAYEVSKNAAANNNNNNNNNNNAAATNAQFYVGYQEPAAQVAAATNAKLTEAYESAIAGTNGEAMDNYFGTTGFAGRINSDGTYSLVRFTPFTDYDPITNKYDKDEVNFVNNKANAVISLNYGINSAAYVSSVATDDKLIATAGKFDTTSSTIYIFAGNDKVEIFKGVAKNGTTIDLTGADTVLLNATADCVFVYDSTKTAAELHGGEGWANGGAVVDPTPNNDYKFYAIVKGTKASVTAANTSGKATLTITGLQEVLTGSTFDLVVTAATDIVFPLFDEINEKHPVTDASMAAGAVIFFSAKESKLLISTQSDEVFEKFGANLAVIWTKYPTKAMNVNLGNLNDPYKLVAGGANVYVQSYALTTFWGDGTVQVVDGSTVKGNFTAHHSMPDNEVAFYAIDKDGNAIGYVFAPMMANN